MVRGVSRGGYTAETRLSLLEHDADVFEASIATIRNLLVGILISTTTASMLLAVNLLVSR